MGLNSRLYEGWVRHRRHSPTVHNFRYPLFMLYLDLDEIDEVFALSRLWSKERFNWASFRREDYFAAEQDDLKQAVIEKICSQSELQPEEIGAVRMLTHLRYLGFVFNPVTIYYAFDHNNKLLAIMPEVTNTPWRERHQYVLMTDSFHGGMGPSRQRHQYLEYRPRKAFHVSPFLPMDMDYRWVFAEPGRTLRVHLENHREGKRVFDATLVMNAQAVNAKTLRQTLIRFPWVTVKVITAIHWQALRLWLKKVPFYRHPRKEKKDMTV